MMRTKIFYRLILLCLTMVSGQMVVAETVRAQMPPGPNKIVRLPCGAGLAQWEHPRLSPAFIPANFTRAAVPQGQLRIDFAGHSTFVVTSPAGSRVITDYNDFHRAPVLPDIATMSAIHRNHNSDNISPVITHALRGWDQGKGPPRHDVTHGDLRVYSVPVNLGAAGPYFRFETSIFVVESQGLCIAHMGLLAHVLTDEMLARLGRIDVLLTPIDQRVSQSFDETMQNIRLIKPRLVIPMHFFSEFTLGEFLGAAKSFFPVEREQSGSLTISRSTLPAETKILYMVPPHLQTPL